MFEELNNQLSAAKENLRRKQKLERQIQQAQESMCQLSDQKSELNRILLKEDEDVRKLEFLSITGLFYTVLGSKERQLEKELQEMLAARLKYDVCCSSLAQLEKELAGYEAESASLCNAESDYAAVMKRKEHAILGVNDSKSQALFDFRDRSSDMELQKKELQEALSAGETVVEELGKAIRSLSSAEGWGTWDMMGGGLIATSIKHSRIDEAKGYAQNANNALSRFQRELLDVNQSINLDIDIGSFNTFADYFFDGLIVDWVVQSKVEQSSAAIRQVAYTAGNVMDSLNKQMTDLELKQASVNDELLAMIENA